LAPLVDPKEAIEKDFDRLEPDPKVGDVPLSVENLEAVVAH
jgi:hypothetical protein